MRFKNVILKNYFCKHNFFENTLSILSPFDLTHPTEFEIKLKMALNFIDWKSIEILGMR
jgi:hypothetical protein